MTCTTEFQFAPVRVVSNTEIAASIYRMRVEFPALARQLVPGQFFMVRIAGSTDPLIGRAFAVYDTTSDGEVDFAYLVAGNLTRQLQDLKADGVVEVWGPLGNGFPTAAVDHLIMVAGGIGYTPFLAVAKEALGQQAYGRKIGSSPLPRISFCYGARSASGLAGVEDFEGLGIDVHLTTDDGSKGIHGPVTKPLVQLIENRNPEDRCAIYCCGPEPMMEAVADVALDANVPCLVSLEAPMACGIGICFSCVAPIKTDAISTGNEDTWDYQRTCIEGPVFDAQSIAWDAN